MSKKSGKSNAFPVEEAINAAAHFSADGPAAGVVPLLSGLEAMAEFYSKRADGAYYKPHQIYYAIYRPKSEFQAPVADRHYQEGSGRPTVQDCEDYYNPVEPFIEGMPGDTQYPLPLGTPFFMKYLKGDESERFGIYGTHEVDEKYHKNTGQVMRTYIATKIIPKMGRSILRDTASRMGYKSTPMRDENGVLHNVTVTCTEVTKEGSVCGGKFKRDGRGDYVCDNCGIIYEREDKFVSEDNGFDDEVEFDDEDNLEEGTTQKDLEVGGVLPASMLAIESRLSRNLSKFRAQLAEAPKDEVAAKEHAHEVKQSDLKARKFFQSRKGHEVYENKWSKSKSKAMRARVLHFIKVDGINTVSGLTKAMAVHNMYVVRAIDELVKSGRLVCESNDKKAKAKVTTLTYVVTGNERAGRCPKEQVMPVLPQVKYGGVARHSDMGSIYQSRCSLCQHKFYANKFQQFVCPDCEGQ
jgi:predicted RNA-binding Zn-ribbon protein involved in translation (DUF1610 family)